MAQAIGTFPGQQFLWICATTAHARQSSLSGRDKAAMTWSTTRPRAEPCTELRAPVNGNIQSSMKSQRVWPTAVVRNHKSLQSLAFRHRAAGADFQDCCDLEEPSGSPEFKLFRPVSSAFLRGPSLTRPPAGDRGCGTGWPPPRATAGYPARPPDRRWCGRS